MSRLGRLLEQYEPGEVLIMSREAYEHRQSTAYASGWKDAADEYRPHISSAWWEGWLGRRRPLRAVGPGEVIPFPAGRRAAEPNGVAGNDAACGAVPQDGVGEARDARGTGLYGHAEDAAGGGGGEAGETSERNRHRRPPDSPSDDPSDVETRAPQSGARSRPSSVKPSLSPKSRRSKSPTIPPLTRPPRRRRPTGDTPEEATD